MEPVSIYYALTTAGALGGYKDGTVVFTSGDNKLSVYDSLEVACSIVPDSYKGPANNAPVLMKFELPHSDDVPKQLCIQDMTQVGYMAYNNDSQKVRLRRLLDQSVKGDLGRVSVAALDDVKADISEKLQYMADIADYNQRMIRFRESAAEILDVTGRLDPEFQRMIYVDFERLLKTKQEEMRKSYGLTAKEEELIHKTRGNLNALGMRLGKEASTFGDSSRVYIPGTELLRDMGQKALKVTTFSEMVASKKAGLVVNGRPIESLEEYSQLMCHIAGMSQEERARFLRHSRGGIELVGDE